MVKSAVVTGASTGIGRATALRLDDDGWRVFAGVRREEDGEALRSFTAAASKGDERASQPEKVAGAIAHALTARRPHTRYLVGIDARGQALLRWLPDRVADRAIAYAIRG